MRIIVLILAVALSGCATYSEVRSGDKKIAFHLEQDYQTAYRLTVENLLGPCKYSPGFISDRIYPDKGRAEVTISFADNVALSMDFVASPGGGSEFIVYPNAARLAKKATEYPSKIASGDGACHF